MEIILFILLFILFVVFAIDFYVGFYTWQSRIHIGRINDLELWSKKILSVSQKWLKKTPVIKLTDNNRLIIIDMLKGNYKRNSIQHWQEAALVLGLVQAFKKTGDEVIKKQISAYIKTKIDDSGHWKQTPKDIDGVILAYAILNADWIDHQKNKAAYDAIWNLIQELVGNDGTVQYRKHMKDYRYVDTIGFICPFLVVYGKKFDVADAITLAWKQIATFNQHALYPGTFIPCHTYHVASKMPVGLFGWGRGLGWYAIGLIDAWKEIPADHPLEPKLKENVISFAKMALQFQNQKGGWGWIIMNDQSITDSSATATLAWFLSNAAEIPAIKESCLSATEKAITHLKKVTRRDGAIDFSQGDTKGIGVHSQEFDILPFTQGFALRTIYL